MGGSLPAAAPPPPAAAFGLAAPLLAVPVVRRGGALALAAPAAAAAAMAEGRAALVFLGARGGLAREVAAAGPEVPGRELPAEAARAGGLPPAQNEPRRTAALYHGVHLAREGATDSST